MEQGLELRAYTDDLAVLDKALPLNGKKNIEGIQMLDSRLTATPHIDHVTRKAANAIGNLTILIKGKFTSLSRLQTP